jgi:hypothetical protein
MTCIARAAFAAALLVLAACYTERPLTAPVPAPATRIVATITDSGAAALAGEIGSGAVALEGVVASADPNAWQLRLLRVEQRDGREIPWNREAVQVPASALTGVMERRLDKRRSWLAAGLVTASAVVAARIFRLVGADESHAPDPVPPH